jgi:hypothetical protein
MSGDGFYNSGDYGTDLYSAASFIEIAGTIDGASGLAANLAGLFTAVGTIVVAPTVAAAGNTSQSLAGTIAVAPVPAGVLTGQWSASGVVAATEQVQGDLQLRINLAGSISVAPAIASALQGVFNLDGAIDAASGAAGNAMAGPQWNVDPDENDEWGSVLAPDGGWTPVTITAGDFDG